MSTYRWRWSMFQTNPLYRLKKDIQNRMEYYANEAKRLENENYTMLEKNPKLVQYLVEQRKTNSIPDDTSTMLSGFSSNFTTLTDSSNDSSKVTGFSRFLASRKYDNFNQNATNKEKYMQKGRALGKLIKHVNGTSRLTKKELNTLYTEALHGDSQEYNAAFDTKAWCTSPKPFDSAVKKLFERAGAVDISQEQSYIREHTASI